MLGCHENIDWNKEGGVDLRIPREGPVTSWMIVFRAPDACDEDFVELLRASADSACWACDGRGMARRRLGYRLLRGHGAPLALSVL